MQFRFAVLAFAAAALAACDRDTDLTSPGASAENSRSADADVDRGEPAGPLAVYTITNQVSGNEVAVFARGVDGRLDPAGRFATGGTGTGAGLGSQGAVILSADGRRLFAVNAGSNDVSVFGVEANGLALLSRTPSGGTRPISLTVQGRVLYVLNAGGEGNISGFSIRDGGQLESIAGSTRALSGAASDPAEVAFSPDGRRLVVTEKATNLIDVFPVDDRGLAGTRASFPSSGATPFGFAFGSSARMVVSEAGGSGSASSYEVERDGGFAVVSGSVPTHQGAPCWVVITRDRRFVYTGNGGGSITGFAFGSDGTMQGLNADGATALFDTGINDIALSGSSRYLYALSVGATPAVHAFRVEPDGQLEPLGTVGGLPAGDGGLAVR
ncbi:MAG TPA: beta-propeller fold lactonase family protein [Gemmatimonadales bacterium]|nr:beta-propeller fold lactonase family protein [Gemmatimonadales bacterium]